MRRRLVAALILCLLAPGCSREKEPRVPVACRQGEDAVLDALRAAPGKVRLEGTPLSSCFADSSDSGDLQEVGTGLLEAAAGLSAAARAKPDSPAATRLGYLIGAARRGTAGHQGVNTELRRRLEQEVSLVDTSTPAFRRGERAGRTDG